MHLSHLFKHKGYEHVVFVLRRHPFILVKIVVLFIILTALPIGIVMLINANGSSLLLGPVSYPLVAVAASIYYLALWLFFFTLILDYYLDLWIVTNDRILSIEQEGLFARTIAEVDLWKVQDVTSEVKGVFPTLMNYGSVFIQTAAERERFIFEQVPNPHHIRQRIIELADEDRKLHPAVIVDKNV